MKIMKQRTEKAKDIFQFFKTSRNQAEILTKFLSLCSWIDMFY